jgi:hypothetical protein
MTRMDYDDEPASREREVSSEETGAGTRHACVDTTHA